MTADLHTFCWSAAQVGELIARLSLKSGISDRKSTFLGSTDGWSGEDGERMNDRVVASAEFLGIEAEAVAEVPYGELAGLLLRAAPALIRLPKSTGGGFLGVLKRAGRALIVLGPDLAPHRVRPEDVRSAICAPIETGRHAEIETLLDIARVPNNARAKVRSALMQERLGSVPIDGIWLLRPSPGAPFGFQLRQAGLYRPIGGLIASYVAQYMLGIFAWWLIGRSILEGRLDWGWFLAWGLSLLAGLPLRSLSTWYQGIVAVGCGGLLKRRLLHGALCLEPGEMRTQGVGQLLGRVIESEAVEALALSSGFTGILAIIEIATGIAILGVGAGGTLQASLFVAWTLVTLTIGWMHWRNCLAWTSARTEMTNDLVEKMIGHQTRLAQEKRDDWHLGEDVTSERYLALSRRMDRSAVLGSSLVPQGWLIVGILGLAPAFIGGRATSMSLAVGLGGTLLGAGALQRLASGFLSLGGAVIAWQQVSGLYRAGARQEAESPVFAIEPTGGLDSRCEPATILDLHEVVYRHPDKSQAVLHGVELRVSANDRLLLEGGSGAGKSTFASLLAGLRVPESGILLLRGLDRQTLGSRQWRRRVALAPQFHENHVLTESFAFNLLMGRRWPPTAQDMIEAERICKELGLAELLERMPAGMGQIVGEGAWQLSHGECSRLFLARALLGEADLTILDESLAALDPENFARALTCAWKRSNALLLIAH